MVDNIHSIGFQYVSILNCSLLLPWSSSMVVYIPRKRRWSLWSILRVYNPFQDSINRTDDHKRYISCVLGQIYIMKFSWGNHVFFFCVSFSLCMFAGVRWNPGADPRSGHVAKDSDPGGSWGFPWPWGVAQWLDFFFMGK